MNVCTARKSADAPIVDLRGYVSCRHLEPVKLNNGMMNPSLSALESCKLIGMSYTELQSGTETRAATDRSDVAELYVPCESVFNDDLWSFTTFLLNGYEACNLAGKIDRTTRRVIFGNFAKLFKILRSTYT